MKAVLMQNLGGGGANKLYIYEFCAILCKI